MSIPNQPKAPAAPGPPPAVGPMASAQEKAALRERLLRNIPPELQTMRRWVGAGGKGKKEPITAVTGTTKGWRDPSNWVPLVDALEFMDRRPDVSGIGFVFHEDSDVIGIDLDHAVADPEGDPDDLVPEAAKILENLRGTYVERSMSGSGFHALCLGKWLDGWKKNPGGDGFHVEMYADARHFVMTGDLVDGHPREIAEAPPGELERIQSELMGWNGATVPSTRDKPPLATDTRPAAPPSPSELKKLAESKKGPPPPAPAAPSAVPQDVSARVRQYLDGVMRGSRGRVVAAAEGSRNDTLNKEAHALGHYVGGGCLEEDDVREHLAEAASECGLDGQEIWATINSGLVAGMASPISAAELKERLAPRPAPKIPVADRLPLAVRFQPGEVVECSDRPDQPDNFGKVIKVDEARGQVFVRFDPEHGGQVHEVWICPEDLVNTERDTGGVRTKLQLLRWDEVQSHEEPPWLIEGVLGQGELAELYGPSGVGKTFAAIGLAFCVATGEPWHGHPVARAGAVYISGEGSVGGIRNRVYAMLLAPEKAPTEQGVPDRRPQDEQQRLNEKLHESLLVHAGAVQLFGGAGMASEVDALIASLKELDDVGLVVVDTVSRCIAGADENSAKDVSIFVAACDRIRHETGACVLLIHHTGKRGGIERGSTVLRCAADVMIDLSRTPSGDLLLECDKMRRAEGFGKIFLTMHPVVFGDNNEKTPLDSLRLRVVTGAAGADTSGSLDELRCCSVFKSILLENFRDDPPTATAFRESISSFTDKYGVTKRDWDRHRQVAIDQKYITVTPGLRKSKLLSAGPGPSDTTTMGSSAGSTTGVLAFDEPSAPSPVDDPG